jgi:hypothetical protein
MDVVGLETTNKTTHCTTDLSACFAATFSTRRRLLSDSAFVKMLVVSRGLFVPTFNVTCPPPCITYNARANAPIVFTSDSTREAFVSAVDKFFTAAPPQPSQQEFPTVIIAVIGASVGIVTVVVVAGIVRMRRGVTTPLPINTRPQTTIFDGVVVKMRDKEI